MEIKVTHSVPYDKGYETRCMYNDGDFWGHSVCAHHVYRDRTHGRQAPVERRLPKCALFGVWLDGEYKKCDACLEACKEALDKPMQKPMTLEEAINSEWTVWVEINGWTNPRAGDVWASKRLEGYAMFAFVGESPRSHAAMNRYGKGWRCWASRPTDEEREAAVWES